MRNQSTPLSKSTVAMEKALKNFSSSTSTSSKDDDRRRIDAGMPIRFVYFDENDNLRLDPNAIDVLQRNNRPVALVSVFGPARQGKSFILNQLLGKSSGFRVSSNHESCTKGLWIWSEPLKRMTLDGTEYDLILCDTNGIDPNDQSGMYSTKIFTLEVLLSTMFIYNKVGPIDEAALDHLFLVTELTKHISLRASERKDSISEFEYATPFFIWLLRDFYLDSMEDNSEITPHDGRKHNRKDIAKRNQIRGSLRAFFPNQECFTLVRPSNSESELQHLDQLSLDKFRPEFRSGLDIFTKFINERTRPKKVGGSTVTGQYLVTITKFFLDVLNDGAFPTIPSSWQIQVRDGFMEANSHSTEVIKGMENELQEALKDSNASLEKITEVLETLISKYEATVHGPSKWQKLSSFLQKSLQGPILLHFKKLIDQISLEKSALLLKSCTSEDKIELLQKMLKASHNRQKEYQKRYNDAIKDFTKVSDQYKTRITDFEKKLDALEEKCSSSLEMPDPEKMESYRADFTNKLAEKDKEIRTMAAKFEDYEQRFASLASDLKAAEMKIENYEPESSSLKLKVKELTNKLAEKDKDIRTMATKIEDNERRLAGLTSDLKAAEMKIENYESESSALKLQVKKLTEARIQLEKKYSLEVKRFEEVHEKLKALEEEAMIKNTETSQTVHLSGQIVNNGSQQHIEDAMRKITSLEATTRCKDEEIELLKKKCEQLSSLIPVENRSSPKLEFTPENFELLSHSPDLNSGSNSKRRRLEFSDAALQKCNTTELGSVLKVEEGDEMKNVGSVDYSKLTVVKLRQELQERGFDGELRKLKNPKKRDILALYKKLVLD